MNDYELPRAYLRDGSETAFTQLVERHVNLVHSAAQRLVQDSHLAEDVTQRVFMLLARKASRLGKDTIMSAWLYRTARHVASETARCEGRRYHREQLAVEAMNQSTPDTAWCQIRPLLDDAMANLRAADHDAVVLRYFENKSLKEVAEAFGCSEDAAQKRVARARDSLQTRLTRRSVTISLAALATAVAVGAVQFCPSRACCFSRLGIVPNGRRHYHHLQPSARYGYHKDQNHRQHGAHGTRRDSTIHATSLKCILASPELGPPQPIDRNGREAPVPRGRRRPEIRRNRAPAQRTN